MAEIPKGVRMEPYNKAEHPTRYTWEKFRKACVDGSFNDDDGFGELATDTHVSRRTVSADAVADGTARKPKWATHVIWYNK